MAALSIERLPGKDQTSGGNHLALRGEVAPTSGRCAALGPGYPRRMRTGLDRRAMADLFLGHLSADLAQGALPAILVFLKPVLHLSYTKTAAVVLVATSTSSISQPLFGRWSDRRTTTWLIPAGVAVSAVGDAARSLAQLRAPPRPRRESRASAWRVPSGGDEARQPCERRAAGERDGGLPDRRESRHRLGPALAGAVLAATRLDRRALLDDSRALRRRAPPAGLRLARPPPPGRHGGRVRQSAVDRPGAFGLLLVATASGASPSTGCSRSSRSGRCRRAIRRGTERATLTRPARRGDRDALRRPARRPVRQQGRARRGA